MFTYKGHGDDYAVVESGLMAQGGGGGVVMQQPVRARRRRTLVLHTPPSNLPSAGPATELGDASPRGVAYYGSELRRTWVAGCFGVRCGRSLLCS